MSLFVYLQISIVAPITLNILFARLASFQTIHCLRPDGSVSSTLSNVWDIAISQILHKQKNEFGKF